MDPSSSMTMANSRQRRVLPSRSRRGGPGVGSCDADVMILETQRRKYENEPLIPMDTPFLLTTNASVALASSDTSRLAINTFANERYFDRPEVLKSYREQLDIQTPEYLNIAETHVGTRFRVRAVEEGTADTSDAAYEKRHRKYETFEKRQRLREKEKLKHEQYKLKERIDQLRAMDSSAFLALPASSFSAPPVPVEGEDYSTNANVNGSLAYNEGERRRKEMLDIALMLEERYRVLLPPDRVRKTVAPRTDSVSLEPDATFPSNKPRKPKEDEPISELDQRALVESSQHENSKIMIKLKVPPRANSDIAHAPPPTVKTVAVAIKKPRASIPPTKHAAAPRKIRGRPSTPPTSGQLSSDKSPTPIAVLSSAEPDVYPYIEEAVVSDIELQTPITAVEHDANTTSAPSAENLHSPIQEEKFLSEEENSSPEPQISHRSSSDVIPPAPESSPPPPDETPFADAPQEIEGDPKSTYNFAPVVEHVGIVKRRGRPPKRPRLSPTTLPNSSEYIPTVPTYRRSTSRAPSTYSSHKQPAHGAIVTAALRNASGGPRTTAKAPRHNTAFGVKLHLSNKDTMIDFELPPWILPYEEARRLGGEIHTVTSMHGPVNEQKSPNIPINTNMLSVDSVISSEGPFRISPYLSTEETMPPTETLMSLDEPADGAS
ncbi:hypothetical protein BDQ17DRAFT_63860 [Cyathus striatus]|nr:hypothetical protein BDQ17DRAFT_63860 [Cyathus striatus]